MRFFLIAIFFTIFDPMIHDFNPSELVVLSKISRFCAFRERSVFETKQKLFSLGVDNQNINRFIDYLVLNNFLNQSRFEESFVRSKVNIKKWGRLKIKSNLNLHGNQSSESINQILNSIDLNQYQANLHQILKRKFDELARKNDLLWKPKLVRFAQSKGYTLDEIFDALKNMNLNSSD